MHNTFNPIYNRLIKCDRQCPNIVLNIIPSHVLILQQLRDHLLALFDHVYGVRVLHG